MVERQSRVLPGLLIFLLTLASAVVVLAGMRGMQDVLSGIILALVLVIVLGPGELWLMRMGLPRWAAFLIVVLCVLVAVLGLLLLMAVSFASLVKAIPQYSDQLAGFQKNAQSALQSLGFSSDSASSTSQKVANPDALIRAALSVVAWIVGSISSFVFTLFILAFMLLDVTGFGTRLAALVTPGTYDHFVAFTTRLRKWLTLTAIINFLVALFNTAFLLWMGVEFAVLWGVLSFFLGFIPNIGFVISLIGPAIFALLEFGVDKAIVVIVVFIVINGAVSNIVQPRLMGGGLNLQPFMMMISVLVWAFILGPVGALLSVPLTLTVLFLIESWPDTAPFSNIVGYGRKTEPPPDAPD
jgi:AI-2 transport protein TqsA